MYQTYAVQVERFKFQISYLYKSHLLLMAVGACLYFLPLVLSLIKQNEKVEIRDLNCSLDKDNSFTYWKIWYGMGHWHGKNDSQAKNNCIECF